MDHQMRGSVESACFSADGRRLLTVSREQVRVWSSESGRLLAPPFVHDVRVNRAVLDASGSRVVISTYPKRDGTAGSPSTIQFWSLMPDPRPVDTLRLEAEVASGRFVDAAGGMMPLSQAQYRARWEALSAGRQASAVDEADVDLWHLQQAAGGDGFKRRFHADRLAARGGERVSSDPAYLTTRAGVLAEAGRVDAAIADVSTAIGLSPDRRAPLAQRGQLYAERGDLALALADLAEACEVRFTNVDRGVRADDVEAAVLHDGETYRAAARRAVRLLAGQGNGSSPEEAWNALFFAVRACTLAPRAGLEDTEWRVLEDALGQTGRPVSKENVALLRAQVALRRGDRAALRRALRGVEFPPWDQVIVALSGGRQGTRDKPEDRGMRALQGLHSFIDQLQPRGHASRPYAPGWPTDLQIAKLLAGELSALLERGS
jgi:tetratricopeptide (TPR) repeat protein